MLLFQSLPRKVEALGSIRVAIKNQWAAKTEISAFIAWLGSQAIEPLDKANFLAGASTDEVAAALLVFLKFKTPFARP